LNINKRGRVSCYYIAMEYLKELKIKVIDSEVKNPVRGQVKEPEDLYQAFKDMESEDKEKVVGVYLNDMMEINCFEVLAMGSLDYFKTSEVFKGALLSNSPNVILLHNHVNRSNEPSSFDRTLIKRLKEQSDIMEINFIDYIVVGEGFWSFFSSEPYGKYTKAFS
jgi:DNA repair protein RadC